MRKYECQTKTEQRNVLVEQCCDICGKKADQPQDWTSGLFEIDETEIQVIVRQKEGSDYPEGGSGTKHDIDLCPDCFKGKLIPWLESQGAKIKQEEWNW